MQLLSKLSYALLLVTTLLVTVAFVLNLGAAEEDFAGGGANPSRSSSLPLPTLSFGGSLRRRLFSTDQGTVIPREIDPEWIVDNPHKGEYQAPIIRKQAGYIAWVFREGSRDYGAPDPPGSPST